MPPFPPSGGPHGNLDRAERQRLRDRYDLDQQMWEREQRQAAERAWLMEAWKHNFELVANQLKAREQAAEAAKQEAKRATRLAQQKLERIRARTQAAEQAAERAIRVARQKTTGAEPGTKTKAKRGPKPSPLSIAIAAEADSRRLAEDPLKPDDASALLKWAKRRFPKDKLAENKIGQNPLSDERKIRRWIERKRT